MSISDTNEFARYIIEIEKIVRRGSHGQYHLLVIQRMTSLLLINKAHHITQQYTGSCNKVTYTCIHDKACHKLQLASKIGYVSDILYLALYYYKTCRYEKSLRCLQRAQERMSVPYAMYGDNVNVEMYIRAMMRMSLSDKMRKAVVSNVILNIDYTYIDELVLEQKVSYMNGVPNLYIPPLVMLHMLSVLNHHRLRHALESHQALQNLQTLLLYDIGVHVPTDQRDISYQILGICQHVCGDYVGALNSYQYSLQQDPFHKLQQASMYRIQIITQT
jgi:tetratricopeptide (TPR) repeat protein